jgi:hypothetical protein
MSTFSLADTKPSAYSVQVDCQKLLREHKVTTQHHGRVRFATEPEHPVETFFGNGFVSAAFIAYSRHHHLVIRPDDVWLAIAVAFGSYVDAHAEEMRSIFVTHEGQQKLSINVPDENWFHIVSVFESLLPAEVSQWIVPNFTTTTSKDRLVGGAVLMASMKNYFSYKVSIECGLSAVTLEGTLDDWKTLREKVEQLEQWSEGQPLLKKWRDSLLPIIEQFIESYQGTVDKEFWNQICHHIPGGSGPSYISGWINLFVPFKEGQWGICSQGPYFIRDNTKYPYGYLETGAVPTGCLEVPITIDDNGREFEAILYAGAIVNSYQKETNQIRPSYDFVVIEK